jgi:hypothetical protein
MQTNKTLVIALCLSSGGITALTGADLDRAGLLVEISEAPLAPRPHAALSCTSATTLPEPPNTCSRSSAS